MSFLHRDSPRGCHGRDNRVPASGGNRVPSTEHIHQTDHILLREGGREGGGGRGRGREGEKEGGREGGREGEREGGREGGREGEREGEGGRERILN